MNEAEGTPFAIGGSAPLELNMMSLATSVVPLHEGLLGETN